MPRRNNSMRPKLIRRLSSPLPMRTDWPQRRSPTPLAALRFSGDAQRPHGNTPQVEYSWVVWHVSVSCTSARDVPGHCLPLKCSPIHRRIRSSAVIPAKASLLPLNIDTIFPDRRMPVPVLGLAGPCYREGPFRAKRPRNRDKLGIGPIFLALLSRTLCQTLSCPP